MQQKAAPARYTEHFLAPLDPQYEPLQTFNELALCKTLKTGSIRSVCLFPLLLANTWCWDTRTTLCVKSERGFLLFFIHQADTCAPSCPGVSTRSSIRCLHGFVLRKLMLTPPSVLLCAVAFTTPPKPAYSYRFLLPVQTLRKRQQNNVKSI